MTFCNFFFFVFHDFFLQYNKNVDSSLMLILNHVHVKISIEILHNDEN